MAQHDPQHPYPNPYSLARKRRRRHEGDRRSQRLTRRGFLLLGGIFLGRFFALRPNLWQRDWYALAEGMTEGWPPRLREPLLTSLRLPDTEALLSTNALPNTSPNTLQAQFRAGFNPVAETSISSAEKVVPPHAGAEPLQFATPAQATKAPNPVKVERIAIKGMPLYRTTIDLTDPDTFITLGLAKNATKANSNKQSVGDEAFSGFLKRYPAAVLANATFFSKDHQKRVMGNMVAEGRFLKYSRWENYGTTLGLRAGRKLEMVTARTDGKPHWHEHWFSLTGGPRLLREGKFWIAPKSEGFRDPSVLGVGSRTAIGFPKNGDKLILATFLNSMTLEREAHAMKDLGCYEAMNLDGGTSGALAHRGKVLLDASRPLTNVLVVYDYKNPAPQSVKDSWLRFQAGERPKPNA